MGASFPPSISPSIGFTPHSAGLGVTINPFAQMAPQQQSQVLAPSQNSFPSTSPFGLSLLHQPSFVPQPQIPQIHWQQPAFTQSVRNPFFNATTPSQGTLSPQTQAPFMSLRHLVHLPDLHFSSQLKPRSNNHSLCSNRRPTQAPFQPQPPQFGNVQSSREAEALHRASTRALYRSLITQIRAYVYGNGAYRKGPADPFTIRIRPY
jgi:hypothetical protein